MNMCYHPALSQIDEKEAISTVLCITNIRRINLEVVSVVDEFLSKTSVQELIVEINLGL